MKERRAITVEGIVQGVGFRPFVHGLAQRLGLHGYVRNRAGSVLIEIEGETDALDHFVTALSREAPPLARIERLSSVPRPVCGDGSFHIESSQSDAGVVFVSPDAATCADCLRELFDPADRRYRYPFLNCTNCGPRLTIVTGAPYDRERTTMAGFVMCAACRAEYHDPTDRRFHAQPIACPACGPWLQARDATGAIITTDDPLALFAAALRAGQIGALKGLGGYHLACDGRSAAAVGALRRRKHRDEKPFALMVRDLAAAAALCAVDEAEATLMTSVRRPIVLLRRRPGIDLAEEVAPGNPYLGIMLPYTPLHHLLMEALSDHVLVMTSGNRSDEPIAHEDEDAVRRLAGIADIFLTHNRPIHVRCDDSVTRGVSGREMPLRRSRGYAPQPLRLPLPCRPTLAVGGQLKGTFALGSGTHAFLSHHLGDLDHFQAYQAFVKDVALYQQLFAIEPQVVAHDLHPDYASTRFAQEMPGTLQRVAVQHHHAHMAACMAEHGLNEPVIGVSFDGTGYGLDGAIWGGEFLVGDYAGFRRAAHLRYVGLPGGDQAVREPWRVAVAHLTDAGVAVPGSLGADPASVRLVQRMLERRLQTPMTSSAGRLFDAVAALADVRRRVSYEGQAAVELEWLAAPLPPQGDYPYGIEPDASRSSLIVDTRPLIQAVATDVARGAAASVVGRRFHSTVVEIVAAVCLRLRQETGLDAVVLSGGVFMNVLLSAESEGRLRAEGFRVYRHRLVPPNDGGLSLGQLAVAAARAPA